MQFSTALVALVASSIVGASVVPSGHDHGYGSTENSGVTPTSAKSDVCSTDITVTISSTTYETGTITSYVTSLPAGPGYGGETSSETEDSGVIPSYSVPSPSVEPSVPVPYNPYSSTENSPVLPTYPALPSLPESSSESSPTGYPTAPVIPSYTGGIGSSTENSGTTPTLPVGPSYPAVTGPVSSTENSGTTPSSPVAPPPVYGGGNATTTSPVQFEGAAGKVNGIGGGLAGFIGLLASMLLL